MIQCPKCKEKNQRVIVQLHHEKKYHNFICGNCRTEFQFKRDKILPLNYQLAQNYESLVRFDILEEIVKIEQKVDKMSYEEKIRRLEELNKKNKK